MVTPWTSYQGYKNTINDLENERREGIIGIF